MGHWWRLGKEGPGTYFVGSDRTLTLVPHSKQNFALGSSGSMQLPHLSHHTHLQASQTLVNPAATANCQTVISHRATLVCESVQHVAYATHWQRWEDIYFMTGLSLFFADGRRSSCPFSFRSLRGRGVLCHSKISSISLRAAANAIAVSIAQAILTKKVLTKNLDRFFFC